MGLIPRISALPQADDFFGAIREARIEDDGDPVEWKGDARHASRTRAQLGVAKGVLRRPQLRVRGFDTPDAGLSLVFLSAIDLNPQSLPRAHCSE